MKHTPLHEEHSTLGARMAEFGGWDMPIQYEGILAEHQHTRTQTGLFDICHMGEFELSGPAAAADLENLLTMKISTLAVGQCRYGFMLNEQGGVIDDLTCYRLGDERYMLVVNAATLDGDADWIQKKLSSQTVFTDRSGELAKLDVQGPQARADLETVVGQPLLHLGYFKAEPFHALETEFLLSRTGYTGELGYELYFPASEAVRVWRALLANENIKPVGLGARDTLRLEM
ncbi:MAG TPA: glycine cleavage system aminomethyltransferase GcvT, partial [Tichowtungia sp.]|nr:glycine cleavage system aminomethyltransferase GcvT [Tichowtungia sp.]